MSIESIKRNISFARATCQASKRRGLDSKPWRAFGAKPPLEADEMRGDWLEHREWFVATVIKGRTYSIGRHTQIVLIERLQATGHLTVLGLFVRTFSDLFAEEHTLYQTVWIKNLAQIWWYKAIKFKFVNCLIFDDVCWTPWLRHVDTGHLDTGLSTLDSRFDGRVIWFKSGPNVVQSSATFKLNNLFNQMH